MRTLLRHGTVVNADGKRRADVLVDGERVAAIGADLPGPADRVIDVTGRLLLPGGVDVHTHLDLPVGDIRTSDDFATGTIAAACGGTTTIVDYATQARGGSLRAALDAWMARASGRAVVDFGFHMCIADLGDGVEAEMASLAAAGVPSFKLFMAYPGRLMLDDADIFRVLRRTTEIGGLVCLHAEDGQAIEVLVREALAAGHTAPVFHARTRPPALEAGAVQRGIALAERAGAPLYIVHLSTALALEHVAAARRRGLNILAETCPQYLLLSDAAYDTEPPEAAKFVMSPPLRATGNQGALWAGLARGDIGVVATDHCPFMTADKARGLHDFSLIPNGIPGIEHRMALLYDAAVVGGRLTVERFADVTAASPARLFGLYPKKGVIAEGSDADIVAFDPAGTTVISAATHHTRVDYNPYEGRVLSGAIDVVLARGEVIVSGGRFTGSPGRGRFLKRDPFAP